MIDRVDIFVQGGDGGAGAVSFRREKFVPRGGPDGGDGGQGGDVILRANVNVSTLAELRYRKRYRADSGTAGRGQRMHGRSGEDLVIPVPVGTEVQVLDGAGVLTLLADLTLPGASVVAAHGGLGGRGNSRFTTSTNQAPRVAERGQKSVGQDLRLELKLISEIGLVGLPNAGKSTLLAAVTSARPKIADYPFTTLEPVLGVVEHQGESYVIADIPGLIEGAHVGVGLGFDFLRHAERTGVLIHVVDGASDHPLDDLETVERELRLFGGDLVGKPRIFAVNKIDIPEAAERAPELVAALRHRSDEVFAISAAAGLGLSALLDRITQRVVERRQEVVAAQITAPEEPVIRPEPKATVEVVKENGTYRLVAGRRLEAMAEMLDLDDREAWLAFHRRLQRLGAVAALKRAGVHEGDLVKFGLTEVAWRD